MRETEARDGAIVDAILLLGGEMVWCCCYYTVGEGGENLKLDDSQIQLLSQKIR